MIRIGICDDDLSVLGQIQRMMDHYRVSRNEEMVTLAFQSPLELIHEIERGRRFDILLMDVLMPVMNGSAAKRHIRALDRADAKTIPIIAMTANAFTEDRLKSKEAGMDEHITKPIDSKLLVKVIAELTGKNAQRPK